MKIKDFPELILLTTQVKDKNMSFKTGEKGTLINRKKFLKLAGLSIDSLIFLLLQHEEKVIKVSEKELGKGSRSDKSALKADALITNTKGIYLSILTADCLPIAVYDPKNKAIGLIHTSRHNIGRIIKNTIGKMIKDFNTSPQKLLVNIGPSIGPCHYEIDLWKKAEDEMKSLKVLKKNIYNSKVCTFESDDYYSHREANAKNLVDNRTATIFGIQ